MAIAPMTLRGLRARYYKAWGIAWPFGNAYLKELWMEARVMHNQITPRVPSPETYQTTLELMRESHGIEE